MSEPPFAPPPPPVEPEDPSQRARRIAIIAYAAGMAISLFWGLSYDLFYDRGVQGEVRAGATSEGSTYVTVHNFGRTDWHDVKVEADGAWFVRFDAIPAGTHADARLREFQNAYRLPRPTRVFFWEGVAGEPPPDFAPARLRPERVRVTCDLGTFESELRF